MKAEKTPTYYQVTKEQLNEGITKCFENVRGLLNTSYMLTSNKNQYALGLYIVAVEEFGKGLLLANCETNDHRVKWHRVPRKLFKGRLAHEEKINAAANHLPNNCTNVFATVLDHPGLETKRNILKDRTWRYRNLTVPLPKGIRGNFLVPVRVGRDMLEDTFYVDWDKKNNSWRFVLTARADRLRAAIEDFQKVLEETMREHNVRVTGAQDVAYNSRTHDK